MARFIAQKTFLEVNDPILFEKITRYLTLVKQPKDEIKDDDELNEPEEAKRFVVI